MIFHPGLPAAVNGIHGLLIGDYLHTDNGVIAINDTLIYKTKQEPPVIPKPVIIASTLFELWQVEKYGDFIPERGIPEDYDEWKNAYYSYKQEIL